MADKDIKQGKIKYIPTGVVFTLPVNDAIETLKTDRGNFEIVDNSFVFPEPKVEVKTTVYQQVAGVNEGVNKEKTLEDLTVVQLKEKLDELKIEYRKDAKKADLIALLQKSIDKDGKGE